MKTRKPDVQDGEARMMSDRPGWTAEMMSAEPGLAGEMMSR